MVCLFLRTLDMRLFKTGHFEERAPNLTQVNLIEQQGEDRTSQPLQRCRGFTPVSAHHSFVIDDLPDVSDAALHTSPTHVLSVGMIV